MNNTSTTPKELQWVKVRAACSLLDMFNSLQAGVQSDVEEAQELFKNRNDIRFEFCSQSNRQFYATRMDDPIIPIGESVVFTLTKDNIIVSARDNMGTKELFSVTISLDDDGNCKFLKDGESKSLESWQVRRKALESLLFRA